MIDGTQPLVTASRAQFRLWAECASVNLVFSLFHPGLSAAAPPAAKSLVVNAVLFLLPAVGWDGVVLASTRQLGMRVARYVGVSTGVFLSCLVVIRLLGLTLTEELAWNAIWLVTNLGCVVRVWMRRVVASRRSRLNREFALGGLFFFSSYMFFYWGATRVVPPQVDQDLEVAATGFGLLNRFEPLLLTDRHGLYFFAHPPLLHFYVGGSFLLHGSLNELQFFDESSRRARDAREGRLASPPLGLVRLKGGDTLYRIAGAEGADYLIVPERGGPASRASVEDVELSRIYSRYAERPNLIESRTPNLFFASTTVALLGMWVARISGRWWIGLLSAAAYASSPEIFVRSSYGGYFAIGGFASIVILLAAERWRRFPMWKRAGLPALTGTFAALADHKLVLLPAVLAVQAATAMWRAARLWRLTELLHPTVIGFGVGTALFWCFGLAVAPAAFIKDHFRDHLLDRITHENPLGYGGYATPLGLWLEFARHTAFVLLPLSLFLMLRDRFWSRVQPSGRRVHSIEVWLLWILVTGVAFTVVDWRMTKHIILLLLPIHLGLTPNRDAPRWRIAVPVVALMFAVVFNVWQLGGLVRDFTAFQVTPAW